MNETNPPEPTGAPLGAATPAPAGSDVRGATQPPGEPGVAQSSQPSRSVDANADGAALVSSILKTLDAREEAARPVAADDPVAPRYADEPPYPGGLLALPRWWARRVFTLDLRSLAFFRVTMALLLLGDLAQRLTDLTAHYTDSGVLARNVLNRSIAWEPGMWSLHQASGDASFQLVMFAVAAVLAVMLLVGYRTKVAAIGSWIMLISLHSRNPLVVQGGDTLLRVMLFWSLFLPIGARWSVDAASAGAKRWKPKGASDGEGAGPSCSLDAPAASCAIDAESPPRPRPGPSTNTPAVSCSLDTPASDAASGGIASTIDPSAPPENAHVSRVSTIASIFAAAFILQLAMVYIFSSMHKYHPVWWKGQAVYYALHIEFYVTSLGAWLTQFPRLMKPFTYMTLIGEGLGPVLLFIPFRRDLFRGLAVVGFMLMHLAFGLCLSIGIFPLVAFVAWSALLPPSFWDWLLAKLSTPKRTVIRIYYDGPCEFCLKGVRLIQTFALLPGVKVAAAQEEPEIFAKLKAENSWVVIDSYGVARLRFEAFAVVMSASPIFFPIGWIARLPVIRDVGDTLYRRVAHNRGGSARALAWMTLRQAEFDVNPRGVLRGVAAVFVAIVLAYLVLWNIRGVRKTPVEIPFAATNQFPFITTQRTTPLFDHKYNYFAFWLRVDQIWDMFSPYPMLGDGYYVIRCRLADGSEVDLFKNDFRGGELTWTRPARQSEEFKNGRWVKYLDNLVRPEYAWARPQFCRWLCYDWNSTHRGEKSAQAIWVHYMMLETLPRVTIPLTEWDLPPVDPKLTKAPVVEQLLVAHRCAEGFSGSQYLPGVGRPNEVERLP